MSKMRRSFSDTSLNATTPPQINAAEATLNTELQVQQHAQDDEYAFPYHYVAQYKKGFSHFFLDTWSINYVSTIEYLLQKVSVEAHTRIVDIGCGDGRFSRELALAYPRSVVTGIDYSPRAIKLAAAMNPDVPNLEFSSVDITTDTHLDAFDCAVLMEVFEHVPLDRADRFMAGVRALLKKDGVLLVTVPHVNKPVEYKHFQHFTAESLTKYLEPYFRIVEVVPFEKISWKRWFISRLLSNRFFILRNPRALRVIYHWYRASLFFCTSENTCQRLFVRAVAK